MCPLNGFTNHVCVHLPVSDLRFGKRHHHELGCKTHMCQLYLRQTFLSGLGTGGCLALLDHPGLQQEYWGNEGLLQHSIAAKVEAPGCWSYGAGTTLSGLTSQWPDTQPLSEGSPWGWGFPASSPGVSVPHTWGCFPCSDLCGFLFPMHVPSSNPQQGGGHPR